MTALNLSAEGYVWEAEPEGELVTESGEREPECCSDTPSLPLRLTTGIWGTLTAQFPLKRRKYCRLLQSLISIVPVQTLRKSLNC